MRTRRVLTTAVVALTVTNGACRSGPKGDVEGTEVVRSALTTTFSLPIPVGLNPEDIVLGGNKSVNVNDRASVFGTNPFLNFPSGGIAAFGSAPELLNVGVSAAAGRIWATVPLLFRSNSQVVFYKTSSSVQQQTGITFGDPTENRSNVTIRKDPIWTVSMSAPSSGTAVNVFGNQPATSLGAGNYGPTTVFSGGTLRLTGGTYGIVSLDLEPGAIVQIDAPSRTTMVVNTGAILRAPLGGAGFVFGYLGTQAVHVESPFTGDLFLAKDADVEIKANSTGHFFANHVTVFEGIHVTGGPLGTQAQTLVRPTETLQFLGQLDPSRDAAEIGTAVLPASAVCAKPTAFVSWANQNLFMVPNIGSATATSPASFPAPTPSPPVCIESVLPGDQRIPPPGQHLWEIKSPGIPSYADVVGFTDNVVTRVGDGTVVMVGATARLCLDPAAGVPQGPGCPGTPPPNGGTCDPVTTSGACVYDAMPGIQCSCIPTGLPFPEEGTFRCGDLTRLEANAFGVRVTHDCGASWTATAVDPSVMGLAGPARDIDRWETYYDPFDAKLYIASSTHPGPGQGVPGVSRLAILGSPASGLTRADQLNFASMSDQDFDALPYVITTALDEQASTTGGTGRVVFLASFRCKGGEPTLRFVTPFNVTKEFSLATSDSTTRCGEISKTDGGRMPFFGIHGGPSIVGTASSPPRFYVAYTGISSSGFEIVNVYAITLRSANNYLGAPDVKRILTVDLSAAGLDALWPQLIRTDSAAGSDLTVDTPVVLRYSLVGGDAVSERAVALYSGLVGPTKNMFGWSILGTYGQTATKCATDANTTCFAGDYRYGSFFQKTSDGKLAFFVPWTGQATKAAADGSLPGGVYTSASMLTIVP